MKKEHYSLAIFCAVLSSVVSSITWVFQGEAVKNLGPLMVAGGLGLGSSGVLFLYLSITKKLPALSQLKKNFRDIFIVTLIRPILGGILFSTALLHTSGIKIMFFTKLEPYFVLFLAWVFEKAPVTGRQLLLLAVHVLGAVMLSTDGHFDFGNAQAGDLVVAGTVLLLAFAYAPAARLSKNITPLGANFISLGIAGTLITPLALYLTPASPWELPAYGWWNLLLTFLLFQVLGLTLWYIALQHMHGWMVSALRASGPVLAAPFAYFLFGQSLSSFQLFGAVLVLATSALIAREHARDNSLKKLHKRN